MARRVCSALLSGSRWDGMVFRAAATDVFNEGGLFETITQDVNCPPDAAAAQVSIFPPECECVWGSNCTVIACVCDCVCLHVFVWPRQNH